MLLEKTRIIIGAVVVCGTIALIYKVVLGNLVNSYGYRILRSGRCGEGFASPEAAISAAERDIEGDTEVTPSVKASPP